MVAADVFVLLSQIPHVVFCFFFFRLFCGFARCEGSGQPCVDRPERHRLQHQVPRRLHPIVLALQVRAEASVRRHSAKPARHAGGPMEPDLQALHPRKCQNHPLPVHGVSAGQPLFRGLIFFN
jgi:hypothetical protein